MVAGGNTFIISRSNQVAGIIARRGVSMSRVKEGEGSGQVPFLLAEQRMGWSLMIFCARATRGRGLPSLDARSGRSVSLHPWRENKQAWREHTYRSMRAVMGSLGHSTKEKHRGGSPWLPQ